MWPVLYSRNHSPHFLWNILKAFWGHSHLKQIALHVEERLVLWGSSNDADNEKRVWVPGCLSSVILITLQKSLRPPTLSVEEGPAGRRGEGDAIVHTLSCSLPRFLSTLTSRSSPGGRAQGCPGHSGAAGAPRPAETPCASSRALPSGNIQG